MTITTHPLVGQFFSGPIYTPNRTEMNEYRKWFFEQISLRIAGLEQAIGDHWQADFTEQSLAVLGNWFEDRAIVRSLRPDEIAAIASEAPIALRTRAAERTLTDDSQSTAVDVGMYLGATMCHNIDSAQWMQLRKRKRNIDYGHVMIAGVGSIPINTVRRSTVIAYQLARGISVDLLECYQLWTRPARG